VRPFDCCCLSLGAPRDPVITPDGFLFDKQAILENLWSQRLAQKARKVRDIQVTENSMRAVAARTLEMGAMDVRLFAIAEGGVGVQRKTLPSSDLYKPTLENSSASTEWPRAELQETEHDTVKLRTRMRACCPMSGKPLKARDLRAVRFTQNTDTGESASEARLKGRFMCPVCYATLRNASRPAVLPSGNVICHSCVTTFLETNNRDPVTGETVESEKDVIFIRSGGTAFAFSGGEMKEAKQYRPSPV
jgi:nitric oxide synthase-interacting protein